MPDRGRGGRGAEPGREIDQILSLLDRLLHHCHVVGVTNGDSYRMKQARARGGARKTTWSTPRRGHFDLAASADLTWPLTTDPAQPLTLRNYGSTLEI